METLQIMNTILTTVRLTSIIFLLSTILVTAQEITKTLPANPYVDIETKSEIKARTCHPNLSRKKDKHSSSESNKNSQNLLPPTNTIAYTQSIHNVIVKWETGSYDNFRIGTTPGGNDIFYGQALGVDDKHTYGHSYEELRKAALTLGTTFNIGDTFYITMDEGLATEWVSQPLQFIWEDLGNPANEITINVETNYGVGGLGPFSAAQATKLMSFYNLVNPMIKDIFGPPSRNHQVNIVNDGFAVGVNTYYNGPNQVSCTYVENADGDLDQPRLMIHELIHAYRDNVTISSDDEWHYDPRLSGFEEGMAEAVAIIVMDEFIEQYPNFFNGTEFKIHWNHARGMPFEWDYDFQNHYQIRNRDYWSTDIATGSHELRYGMGATAFRKMYIEDPDIFKKFNQEYYNRLNADHTLIPDRNLMLSVFNSITTEVERTPVQTWINQQKIFDCDVDLGKKIFMLSYTQSTWNSFQADNRIYFLETHQNGLEWNWGTTDLAGTNEVENGAVYGWTHQLNNVPGTLRFIRDWDNTIYRQRNIINDGHWIRDRHTGWPGRIDQPLLGPYQGPNPYYYNGIFTRDHEQDNCTVLPGCGKRAWAIGSQTMYTSTSDVASFWPTVESQGGTIYDDRVEFDMDESGLFVFQVTFDDPNGPPITENYYRLLGNDFIDLKGVFGGIYSDNANAVNGKLVIEHEDFGEEALLDITTNSFKATRTWASVPEIDPNRQGGRSDRHYSVPGKTHTIFISDDCTQRKIDFRTIGYGDGLDGVQMMLYKVEDFEDIVFTASSDLNLCPGDTASFTVSNNFPTILNTDSRITYSWTNPSGVVVSTSPDYTIPSVAPSDQGIYELTIDFFGCQITKTVELIVGCTPPLTVDFDGVDDYIATSAFLGNNATATQMAWVRLNTTFSSTGGLMGQSNNYIWIAGDGKINTELTTSSGIYTLSSNESLTNNVWEHVATVYDGITLKIYLNGEEVASTPATGNITPNSGNYDIGRTPNGTQYLHAFIDDARVYNTALNLEQLQTQVYQEIEVNGSDIYGLTIPKIISGLPANTLELYYKMDPISLGKVIDQSTYSRDGTLYNITTVEEQNAPMPYIANTSGVWENVNTWQFGAYWDISNLPNKDWAIVRITNNASVTTTNSHNHLGLIIDSGSSLQVLDDNAIYNTSYFQLDGVLDLQGESQLIQTNTSDLAVTSAGVLERDQQGKGDIYSFNYWSSPVSSINISNNNTPHSPAEVLKDGTDPNNTQNITFTTGYDGAPTTPITLSNFWFFTYENQLDDYTNWTQLFETGLVKAGQGFTMKGPGSGTTSNTQNYVFVGKPNNGDINHNINPNNLSLLGNPYPSAIDANQFILDNINVIDENGDIINAGITTGALYFWEHFPTNNSHALSAYEGGYATYNLAGATMAIPDPDVSANGTGTKLPQRYIPVGQAFFVQGGEGGAISFNNNQRTFVTEASGSSIFMFTSNDEEESTEVSEPNDDIDRIYFKYNIPNGPSRQLLLAMKEGKSLGVDYGYDAKLLENNPSDASWIINDSPYVIQTIGALNEAIEIPLRFTSETATVGSFTIQEIQGVASNVMILLKDRFLNSYTDLRVTDATIELNEGVEDNRYVVVFKMPTQETPDVALDKLEVFYSDGFIYITNEKEFNAKQVKLYNVVGQQVLEHSKQYEAVNEIKFPVNLSSGVYLVNFSLNGATKTSKVLID